MVATTTAAAAAFRIQLMRFAAVQTPPPPAAAAVLTLEVAVDVRSLALTAAAYLPSFAVVDNLPGTVEAVAVVEEVLRSPRDGNQLPNLGLGRSPSAEA